MPVNEYERLRETKRQARIPLYTTIFQYAVTIAIVAIVGVLLFFWWKPILLCVIALGWFTLITYLMWGFITFLKEAIFGRGR